MLARSTNIGTNLLDFRTFADFKFKTLRPLLAYRPFAVRRESRAYPRSINRSLIKRPQPHQSRKIDTAFQHRVTVTDGKGMTDRCSATDAPFGKKK